MAFLRKTFSFGDSEIDAIADLARDVQEVHLPKGEVLWNVGDRSTYFLLPLRGVVDCRATDPDQHFQLGPSDSVGAIDAMADERRWFRAEVAEDLVAFRIDQELLLEVLEDHFAMAMSLLRSIAAGILHLYDQGHSLPPKPPRIAALPVKLAPIDCDLSVNFLYFQVVRRGRVSPCNCLFVQYIGWSHVCWDCHRDRGAAGSS